MNDWDKYLETEKKAEGAWKNTKASMTVPSNCICGVEFGSAHPAVRLEPGSYTYVCASCWDVAHDKRELRW